MTGRTSSRHRDSLCRNAVAAACALAIVATLAIAAPALASEFSVPAGQNTANFTTFEEKNTVTIKGGVSCGPKSEVAEFISHFISAMDKLNNAGPGDSQVKVLASDILPAQGTLSDELLVVSICPSSDDLRHFGF